MRLIDAGDGHEPIVLPRQERLERGDARAAARALEALGLRVDETLAAVVEAALGGGLLRRSALTALATARSLPADAEGAFLAAPAPTQVCHSFRTHLSLMRPTATRGNESRLHGILLPKRTQRCSSFCLLAP